MRSLLSFACALVLCVMCHTAAAQQMDLSGIAHVAFRVSSIDKSRSFYERLGFEQAFEMSKNGMTTQSFIKVNDRQFIELYPTTSKDSAPGFMHLCFQSSDLKALYAAYVARGLSPTSVRKAGAGNLLFTLAGPEHQNIEYTQYMPGSLHENDVTKHLGSHRISTQFTSVAIGMHNPSAAVAFYVDKLSFHMDRHHHEEYLLLPGGSGESVQFKLPGDNHAPDITFQVPNLRNTIKELKAMGFSVNTASGKAYIKDPDGNSIGFVSAPHGRR